MTLRSASVGSGDAQRDLGDLQTALASYTEALQLDRRLVEAYGQTPDTLRSLSVGLDHAPGYPA